jgi:hypothetical protein
VFSAALKLKVNHLGPARKRLREKLMRSIQRRVLELIGDHAPDIKVDLIVRTIELHKQVEFEGGKAGTKPCTISDVCRASPSIFMSSFSSPRFPSVVKPSSMPLLGQLTYAMESIDQTCEEFQVHPFLFSANSNPNHSIPMFRWSLAVLL